MPSLPIAVFIESGLYIQNLTFEPLGAALTDLGSSKLCCLDCSKLPAPPLYKLIPLLGLVCLTGVVVVVVVAVAGKAPAFASFFQTSFSPDINALTAIARKTASKTITIEIFSGRETISQP